MVGACIKGGMHVGGYVLQGSCMAGGVYDRWHVWQRGM